MCIQICPLTSPRQSLAFKQRKTLEDSGETQNYFKFVFLAFQMRHTMNHRISRKAFSQHVCVEILLIIQCR